MVIACYARKSNDKINESIKNQISIIRSYISRQEDFQNAEIIQFTDEHCSGINVNRDGFQELLTKVRMREIDVVIVKDLSRLGRNYIDVCKLTDSIFPFMKVRLIAVSENYDSKYRAENTMDLPSAFKSVLNQYYVMESSKKISESCRARLLKGEFLGAVPYGYVRIDKNRVAVDEEKAEIVRKMFRIFTEKRHYTEVAKFLNERKILTNRNSKWTPYSVKIILQNEEYTGKRFSFKQKRNPKIGRYVRISKENWHENDNRFPQIVSRELFESVQKLLPKSRKSHPEKQHIMAYKLYCAKCGRTLKRGKNFSCQSANYIGGEPCFQGHLNPEVLYDAVLKKVKNFISTDFPSMNFSFSDLSKAKSEIAGLKEKKAEIFRKFFDGVLTQAEFEHQNFDISNQIAEKQNTLKQLQNFMAIEKNCIGENPFDTLKRLYLCEELTTEHMQFVKRINVFDAEHFEIILQSESPLSVLCKNIDIYGEV